MITLFHGTKEDIEEGRNPGLESGYYHLRIEGHITKDSGGTPYAPEPELTMIIVQLRALSGFTEAGEELRPRGDAQFLPGTASCMLVSLPPEIAAAYAAGTRTTVATAEKPADGNPWFVRQRRRHGADIADFLAIVSGGRYRAEEKDEPGITIDPDRWLGREFVGRVVRQTNGSTVYINTMRPADAAGDNLRRLAADGR